MFPYCSIPYTTLYKLLGMIGLLRKLLENCSTPTVFIKDSLYFQSTLPVTISQFFTVLFLPDCYSPFPRLIIALRLLHLITRTFQFVSFRTQFIFFFDNTNFPVDFFSFIFGYKFYTLIYSLLLLN